MNRKIKYMITIASLVPAFLISACAQDITGAVKKNDRAELIGNIMPERNPANQTITYMKGDSQFSGAANSGKTPEEQSLAFLRANRQTLLIHNPDEEFRVVSIQKDNLGYTRVRLDQKYQGLPVWGGNIALHFNPEGALYLFRGEYFPTPAGVDIHTSLNKEQLLAKAIRMNPSINDTAGYSIHKKWIYFIDDKRPVLAYELKPSSQLIPADNYIVDAATGKFLNRLSNIQTHGDQ